MNLALRSKAGANLDEATHVHRNFIANPAIGPNTARQDGTDTDHNGSAAHERAAFGLECHNAGGGFLRSPARHHNPRNRA